MRIAVLGRTGQVATELQRQGEVSAFGRDRVDFSDPAAVSDWARTVAADAIVNAAAYTAVDKAETDEALALTVNGTSVGALARAAAARNIPLIHISTDYVFDGTGAAPFAPGAPTAPLGAYGRTKLAGEDAIRAAGGVHAILRTSWVVSAHGGNFVKTMLRLGAERAALTVVADQVGGPTPAADIARACLAIAEQLRADPGKTGTYHYSGAPDVSWAGFAREIMARAGLTCAVTDIPTSAYPTPAKRPLNSRLDCRATEVAFGLPRPDWRAGLADILHELEATPT